MTNKHKSYFYIAFTIIFWGSAPAISKLLVRNLNNLQAVFFISLFAIMSLFLVISFQNKLSLFKSYSKRDYGIMSVMGLIGCFLYAIFIYGAYMLAPAQEVYLVNYLWPIFVVIFATLILKEKITFKKIFGIVLGFLGIYIIISRGEILTPLFSHLKGDLLAIGAACSWGLFSVLGKKLPYEKLSSMLIYFCFGFIFITISALLFSYIPIPSLKDLFYLIYLGVFTWGLAYVFWFKALEYGDTAKMANFVFLAPFVSLIFIHLIVGEKILWASVAGLLVIIAAILIQSTRNTKSV